MKQLICAFGFAYAKTVFLMTRLSNPRLVALNVVLDFVDLYTECTCFSLNGGKFLDRSLVIL